MHICAVCMLPLSYLFLRPFRSISYTACFLLPPSFFSSFIPSFLSFCHPFISWFLCCLLSSFLDCFLHSFLPSLPVLSSFLQFLVWTLFSWYLLWFCSNSSDADDDDDDDDDNDDDDDEDDDHDSDDDGGGRCWWWYWWWCSTSGLEPCSLHGIYNALEL